MENNKINEHASIYVGDLHHDVNEPMLFEFFKGYGTILSIRVCRDIISSKSLGYAYVNFQLAKDAKDAMENMNFEQIYGRPCRIMWSDRNPDSRKSNVANIFIKNLEKSITTKEIHDTFENFGEIISCKVEMDHKGVSKGFAFVNYKHEEDALKAIEIIHGKLIRNKIVHVGKFIPESQRQEREKHFTNCFIKNFGDHLNESSLKKLFEPFGEIITAKVDRNAEGVSNGFGFVNFKTHGDAVKAIENLNGKEIEDKIIYVGRAMKADERQKKLRKEASHKPLNLYVKYLDKTIDDERLKEMFSQFGKIISAKVMLDDENVSKGFGFVCFSTVIEAVEAIDIMHGKSVDGNVLYVSRAQNKEERANKLSFLFDQKMFQWRTMKINEVIMNSQFVQEPIQ